VDEHPVDRRADATDLRVRVGVLLRNPNGERHSAAIEREIRDLGCRPRDTVEGTKGEPDDDVRCESGDR
jgi:hypothetical protein